MASTAYEPVEALATPDMSGPGLPFSADGASARGKSRPHGAAAPFRSILFEQPEVGGRVDGTEQPDFFVDLNLDQVLESVTAGREAYDLKPFFYVPLREVAAVQYRHEVLRDLETPAVLESIRRFAEAMGRMREHLAQVEKLHDRLQRQAWFLDAGELYCQAVRCLVDDLAEREVTSCGFQRLRGWLAEYAASERFASLVAETEALKDALAEIRYAVHIHGARVTVSRYDGEADYSAEVQETFARFQQGRVRSYLVKLLDIAEMDHVEARILELVARLHPEVFGALADYCARHGDYLDATVATFDREVQFYLAYLELIGRFRAVGLPFCYPEVSARSKALTVRQTFDIAQANKLVPQEGTVVGNDLDLSEAERVFVVSGPNNGGKTTFARTFGQLHYLAGLGLLVPGSEARLFLPDRIYTHFEREEDIETLRGKFDDELVRVHDILERATSDSVIVMNESFNSTSLHDALFVGSEVIRRILELGALAVYVTFVDEIATLSEATVSVVSEIVPDSPAQRTFKLVRKPADGLAYASAIAEKYGLRYERLIERIGA
jgi:DNA mismatch repair protein MutS